MDSSKLQITINVSGPGECIGNEMLIIEEALKSYGYNVIVKDEYPPENREIHRGNNAICQVTLKAIHCPWGG